MKTTRRNFVKTTSIGTLATLGLGMAACATSGTDEKQSEEEQSWPSDRLNLAFVGAAGRGRSNLRGLSKLDVNVVALCDVDWGENTEETFQEFPKARRYKDFRVMLERQKDIDGVVIFTESLQTESGGYSGHWFDNQPDVEYTFYALLVLGALRVNLRG